LVISCVLFFCGCAQQDSYRITTHAQRRIKWEGPVPKQADFDESHNYNDEQLEMVVTNLLKKTDPKGGRTEQVTINSLKCVSVIKGLITVDFDSSRKSDANNPLAKLVGKSYTIESAPDNSVTSISGLDELRSLITGRTRTDQAALSILSPDAVKERHSMLLLPQEGIGKYKPGDHWSKIKTISFDQMGIKSYEKIYTLEDFRREAGRRIAVINMGAIPSSEVEPQFRNQQARTNFPKIFDTNETFTGEGRVDLKTGRLNSYREDLRTSWVTALPSGTRGQADANEPVVLRMTAIRSYSLEKIGKE
jgi:hypothetical protein